MRIPEFANFEGLEARSHALRKLSNGHAALARRRHFRADEVIRGRRSRRSLTRTAAATLCGRLGLAVFAGIACRLPLGLAGTVRLVGNLRLASLVSPSSRLVLSRGGRLFLARPIALGRLSLTGCRILRLSLFGLRGASLIGSNLLLPCGRIAGLTPLIGRYRLRLSSLGGCPSRCPSIVSSAFVSADSPCSTPETLEDLRRRRLRRRDLELCEDASSPPSLSESSEAHAVSACSPACSPTPSESEGLSAAARSCSAPSASSTRTFEPSLRMVTLLNSPRSFESRFVPNERTSKSG